MNNEVKFSMWKYVKKMAVSVLHWRWRPKVTPSHSFGFEIVCLVSWIEDICFLKLSRSSLVILVGCNEKRLNCALLISEKRLSRELMRESKYGMNIVCQNLAPNELLRFHRQPQRESQKAAVRFLGYCSFLVKLNHLCHKILLFIKLERVFCDFLPLHISQICQFDRLYPCLSSASHW